MTQDQIDNILKVYDHAMEKISGGYMESIAADIRNDPFFQIGMRVCVSQKHTGIVQKQCGFDERIQMHTYDILEDGGAVVFTDIPEWEIERITAPVLRRVK